ncbi:MAG: hypothetical protein JWM93_2024 [Frankiales bacterium]|nr:hypothetical protein [Frankiales bacterium]
MSESWSNPEIVRTLTKLTASVDKLVDRLDRLGDEYVRREVYDITNADFDRRIIEIGGEVTNLGADQSRHHREHTELQREAAAQRQSTWTTWVPPIVLGIIGAVTGAVVALLTH